MRSVGVAVVWAMCLLGARAPWAVVGSVARLPVVGTGAGAGAHSGAPAGPAAGRLRYDGPSRAVRSGAVRSRGRPPPLDVLVLLDLLDAAIASGVSLPRALTAVGAAAGGVDGEALARASSALVMGADWATAWTAAPTRLGTVIDALAPTWATGAAPGPALRAAAEHLRRERRGAAREAAGRLGVHLVLPLGLCFLPAFVLIGLVPLMVSLGSGLLG